jgi:hypothetical protein
VLFLLTCLFGYTTNITHAFEEEGSTYATLIGFYLAARLFMASYLLLISWLVPMVRSVMIYHTATILVAVALWIGSIHVEYPNQLALIWIALFIELTGSVGHVIIKALLASVIPSAAQWFDKKFEFYPGELGARAEPRWQHDNEPLTFPSQQSTSNTVPSAPTPSSPSSSATPSSPSSTKA